MLASTSTLQSYSTSPHHLPNKLTISSSGSSRAPTSSQQAKPTNHPPFKQHLNPTPAEEEISSCAHATREELRNGESRLKKVVRSGLAKRRKLDKTPKCSVCHLAPTRALSCLSCDSVCCVGHVSQHPHHLHYESSSQSIFCTKCDDYIYNQALESRIGDETKSWREQSLSAQLSKDSPLQWTIISNPAHELPFPRGLKNLGQTCYMSAILQTFLFNPILRSYYFADQHNRATCDVEGPCMSCELDKLFSESFSNDKLPFGPTSILHAFWKSGTELSGYAQQDAHEFLIESLNLIHNCTPSHTNSVDCPCIVHTTFSGLLTSSVKCQACSATTTSSDPFLDLSLDLSGGVSTLLQCLDRFTSIEKLEKGNWGCESCGKREGAEKQLRVGKAPPVLCVQLKRFEHGRGSSKIDKPIRFPLKLDLRPYSTVSASESDLDFLQSYELSSVVCHEGELNNGHYTNYCRACDDFFSFDDDKVRKASLTEVMNSKAYLLTYVRSAVACS